jgi:hypothetical protein
MTRMVAVRMAFALALSLLGCQMRTAIWVVPGSTLEHLEFGVSNKRDSSVGVDFGGLRVWACDSLSYGPTGAAWVLATVSDVPPHPTRIVYGEVPIGFRSVQGPHPLQPGCYRVSVTGTGIAEFWIREDGSIVEAEL